MSKLPSPTSFSAKTESACLGSEEARAAFADRLTVNDLRKSFLLPSGEQLAVLRGVSFAARAGEAVAIVGSSGAGKSTLLHLLGGLEAADHGSMVAGEFAIDRAGPTELTHFRNRQVGFVFQFHHLLPDLTAAENVSLPLLIAGVNRRRALVRAQQLLAEVGLDARVSASLIAHLSGGEQQRVALCRALIAGPGLLLADEPTGNLDAAMGAEVVRHLIDYAHAGDGVLVVATHSQALAAACDRTLVLREGRLYDARL